MLFADRYRTEEELSNAVGQFRSWHQVVKVGLARIDDGVSPQVYGGRGSPTRVGALRATSQVTALRCRGQALPGSGRCHRPFHVGSSWDMRPDVLAVRPWPAGCLRDTGPLGQVS